MEAAHSLRNVRALIVQDTVKPPQEMFAVLDSKYIITLDCSLL